MTQISNEITNNWNKKILNTSRIQRYINILMVNNSAMLGSLQRLSCLETEFSLSWSQSQCISVKKWQ